MARLLERVGRFIDDVLLLPEELRGRLERAERALERDALVEAARHFERVLAERPSLLRAAVGLYEARQGLGDLAAARAALEVARALAPDEPELAVLHARLCLDLNDPAAAADAARDAAVRLSAAAGAPFVEACRVRARAESLAGRPDRAVRELRKALSVAAGDVDMRVALVEALVATGRDDSARRAAAGLGPPLGDALAVRLGLALAAARGDRSARPWLEQGAAAGSDAALLALARGALREGDLAEAEARARLAVSRGAGADALEVLAEATVRDGRRGEAADALAAASAARGGDPALLESALRVAPLDDRAALARHVAALDAFGVESALVAACRVLAAEVPQPFHLSDASEPRVCIAAARAALHEGDAPRALGHLDRWPPLSGGVPHGELDRDAVDSLRRACLRATWRNAEGQLDLAAAIDAVGAFARGSELLGGTDAELDRVLAAVARDAAALRDELDRPLLLAVLGEFNAGKSTLINAFVGADVAPTGVLPTTATLNLLRGGAERRVRLVCRDGTTREGGYDELRALLREAANASGTCAEGPPAVDRVEIVLPVQTLEHVWILDTPGTNALDPAHERLAREAARRADAALWVFDAAQAGKRTEARVLEELRRVGRAVVPVLNKADRLGPGDLERVCRQVRDGLGDIGELSCIAARDALSARLAGDDDAYEASGFPALLARLERDVFAKSRTLKRRACAGRLIETLDEALATEAAALGRHAAGIDARDGWEAHLRQIAAPIASAVKGAVDRLEVDLDAAFVAAAEEVLAFVKPRAYRFASHGADPEDRAFLLDGLAERLRAVTESSGHWLERAACDLLEGAPADVQCLHVRVGLAVRVPLEAHVGYQHGLLEGGTLSRFFDKVLPSATLDVATLREGLSASRHDARTSLRPAWLQSLGDLLAALHAEATRDRCRAQRAQEALRARVFAPLDALRSVAVELTSGGPASPD